MKSILVVVALLMPPGALCETTRSSPPASAEAAQPPSRQLHEQRRMTQIIGARVYDEDGEAVGSIDDVMMGGLMGWGGPSGPLAVLQVNGFLGLGSRLLLVHLNDLHWDVARERIVLSGVNREALRTQPAFTYSAAQARR